MDQRIVPTNKESAKILMEVLDNFCIAQRIHKIYFTILKNT